MRGTRQPSKNSSRVSDDRSPILRSGGPTVYPGVPEGTMTIPNPSSVRQSTMTMAQMSSPALLMKILAPSITHSSPSRTARVLSAAVSEPASGSVIPPALTSSPRTVGRMYASRHAASCSPAMRHRLGALDADPQRHAERHVNAADLFEGKAERQRARIAAAELLAKGHAGQAERAEAPVEVVVEARRAVALLGARSDLAARELADGALNLELRLCVAVRIHRLVVA